MSFGQTKLRTGVRIIKLRHIVSGNVVDCYDDGCDENGRPNQQRQHLENVLKKRIRFEGDDYRTFMLCEPPGQWIDAPGKRISDDVGRLRAGDRFDTDKLRDSDGQWLMPSPKWLATATKLAAVDRARSDDQASQARAKRATKGLEGLSLLQQLAAALPQPATAPKVVAK